MLASLCEYKVFLLGVYCTTAVGVQFARFASADPSGGGDKGGQRTHSQNPRQPRSGPLPRFKNQDKNQAKPLNF